MPIYRLLMIILFDNIAHPYLLMLKESKLWDLSMFFYPLIDVKWDIHHSNIIIKVQRRVIEWEGRSVIAQLQLSGGAIRGNVSHSFTLLLLLIINIIRE